MRPTMKEIARRAGVSRPTVSMILNNKPYAVTDETRERVWRIARELDYRPSYTARSLKEGKTGCIGFVSCFDTHGGNAFYHDRIVAGIERRLADDAENRTLIRFGSGLEESFARSLSMIERGAVDGLVLNVLSADLVRFEAEVLPGLQKSRMPLVVVHGSSAAPACASVGLDTAEGGRLAARHLLEKGYRDAGVQVAVPGSPRCEEPAAAFAACMEGDGATVRRYGAVALREKNGVDAFLREFLAQPCRALFVPDDVSALHAKRVLSDAGTRVPEDVALVGFDDVYTFPDPNPLTTLSHAFTEQGETAAAMLLGMIDEHKDVTQVLVKPTLIVRKTT